jgi:penicillin-binding protein 2
LAMVSAPDYDLNQFSYVTTRNFLNELYGNPERPAFNRATMSRKPPGSTYKMLSAIAALDLGIITPSTTIYCGGGFTFGRFFKCHGGSHGSINVLTAIEKSCNTFFYNLIYKIGIEKWSEYSNKMGFGVKTGIDIGEEDAGLIPNSSYYEKRYGIKWPRSIMASLAIGQGEVSATPLQLAMYTALMANKGKGFKPHIVKGYLDDVTREFIPLEFDKIETGIKTEVFDVVNEGLFRVVHGAGTATRIRMKDVTIAGKTGTSQNPHGKDHALFICFAPHDNPKIAIAVVVENIGYGGTHAAPIAQKMIEAYLLKDKTKNEDNVPHMNVKFIGASLAD